MIGTRAEEEIGDNGSGLIQGAETGKLGPEQNQGLDPVPVSTNRDRLRCYRCSEYDHFARECPSAVTGESSDQEDSDSATLQMLTQDEILALNYAEMEDLNM